MDGYYEMSATPNIHSVRCPKHNDGLYMKKLQNGLFGQKLWYCARCDRPYYLKPHMMKETEFDREELDKQVKPQTPTNEEGN